MSAIVNSSALDRFRTAATLALQRLGDSQFTTLAVTIECYLRAADEGILVEIEKKNERDETDAAANKLRLGFQLLRGRSDPKQEHRADRKGKADLTVCHRDLSEEEIKKSARIARWERLARLKTLGELK